MASNRAPIRGLAGLAVVVGVLASATSATALGLPPVDVIPPSISGSAQQGQTVTCTPGTWLNNPASYSYSWQRDATTSIGGADDTYTLGAADVGHAITCTVTAGNGAGNSLPAVSAPILPVGVPAALVPIELVPPTISGSAAAGQTVACSTGSWLNNPTSYSYSWQRDVVTAIAGATGSSYTLTGADVNHAITCSVVAHNGAGDSVTAVSAPVVPASLPSLGTPLETALPVISGSPEVGQTVSCLPGGWTNNPTSFAYGWQRSGAAIGGATSSSYTLTSADVNQAITCAVVALNALGVSIPAISLPIIVAGAAGPTPTPSPGQNPGSGGGGGLRVPSVSALWVSPHPVVIVVRGRRRHTSGATFHFVLDQGAGVLIEIQQRMSGRWRGERCAAVTPQNRGAVPCARWVTVRVRAVRNAHAGANQYRYLGLVGNGPKLLSAGLYRVYVAANNGAGWSQIRSKQFKAVRKVKAAKRRR